MVYSLEEAAKLATEYESDPKSFLQWLASGNPKLAAEIALEQGLLDQVLFAKFRKQWQNTIIDIIHHPHPLERHAVSTVLAWLDWDNRSGIRLDADGLPDIDWLEIPAGGFVYQENDWLNLDTYWMSRYPVTNIQFRAFISAADGYENADWWQGLEKPGSIQASYWKESNRPVEQVDWYEAMAFCRWLSAKSSLKIHLPTEQQWEKAAGGIDGWEYPWGNEFKSELCNANNQIKESSAVGIYPNGQSRLGLMDMAGNVWEWCLNKYHKPQMVSPDFSNSSRVVRGGSWDLNSGFCRSTFRGARHPHSQYYPRGFRLCCVCSPILPPTDQ